MNKRPLYHMPKPRPLGLCGRKGEMIPARIGYIPGPTIFYEFECYKNGPRYRMEISDEIYGEASSEQFMQIVDRENPIIRIYSYYDPTNEFWIQPWFKPYRDWLAPAIREDIIKRENEVLGTANVGPTMMNENDAEIDYY